MKSQIFVLCVLLAVVSITSAASATLLSTSVQEAYDLAGNGFFPIASTDLGQAVGTVISGSGTLNNYGNPATFGNGQPTAGAQYLFDGGAAYGGKYFPDTATVASFDPAGTYSPSYNYGATYCDVCPSPGASVTVTFAPSSLGYNLASIVSLTGCQYDRQVQAYDISVLPHGSSTWTDLGVVHGGTDYWNTAEVQLTVTGPSGGLVASGVDAVMFTFEDGTPYGATYGAYSVYREIDINGAAAVPEPGTLALLTAGLLGLLAYAWRKRRSCIFTLCVLLAVVSIASTASATLITTPAQASNLSTATNGYFPISSTDLGQAAGTTITSSGYLANYGGGTIANGDPAAGAQYLFDGGAAYGGKYYPSGSLPASSFDPGTNYGTYAYGMSWLDALPSVGASVTATFAPSTLGYDISSIVSLTGSQTGRTVQAYDIAVLPHGSSTWTDLGIVSGGEDLWGAYSEVQLTVTGPSAGLVASGVDAVKITFQDERLYGSHDAGGWGDAGPGAVNQGSEYREIDINGAAAVPEPGTLALLTAGLLGLLAYAWRKRKSCIFTLCVLLAVVSITSTASATIISTVDYTISTGDGSGFAASGTDLATNASLSAPQGSLYAGNVAKLTDGSKYGGHAIPLTNDAYTPDDGYTVTMTFNTGAGGSATGYSIAKIVSITGLDNDRIAQNYDVQVWSVGASDWASLCTTGGSVGPQQQNLPSDHAGEVRVTFEDSAKTGLSIANNVEKLLFTFHNASGHYDAANAYYGGPQSVYREIDVFASAPVPEPSTMVLLATGLLGLLCYAWRKRK